MPGCMAGGRCFACIQPGRLQSPPPPPTCVPALQPRLQIQAGAEQRLYNMIDVLSAGAMR